MNAGYVRLSKDDDRRNYSSIENQKLIISQYAAERNLVIDRWYEDDGVSGYIFDRPGFNQLMADLEKDIDTVFVKDFSRLGRHNGKILLLLDQFQERGRHLVVIDDHYDSEVSEDDMIGITTWFNERYVKDTSKKIRRALEAKQKEGTLVTQPPFGYRRTGKNRQNLEIVPREAECVKLIYDLYIQGFGYRKISAYLTGQNMPTPSAIRRKRELEEGRNPSRQIAEAWSDGMVKNILDNDFYIGALRLRKRVRKTVHGKDRRVPKEEQYVFEHHHPPIIDKMTYDLVQELKEKRTKSGYKGSRGLQAGSVTPDPFGSCLFCRDCGSKLTPVTRQTSAGTRKYYICSAYNTRGKRYCRSAHLIEERDLMKDVVHYIRMCRNVLCKEIAAWDLENVDAEKKSAGERRAAVLEAITEAKKQLRVLLSQKTRDLAGHPGNKALIQESYDSIQQELTEHIHNLELTYDELKHKKSIVFDTKENPCAALNLINDIIQKGCLTRKDIEILIDRISVDGSGLPEIELKCGLPEAAHGNAAEEMNRRENERIFMAMRFISEDNRGFTSAKYLSGRFQDAGDFQSIKSVQPYISAMINMGIMKPSGSRRRPYTIVKGEGEIEEMITNFCKVHCMEERNLTGDNGKT